jgi:hypothetical protein
MGGFSKMKFAQINLVNTSTETTETVTPADCGMNGFLAWIPVNQAAAVVSIVPTYTGALCTSLAITHSSGNEVDLFLFGV